MHFLVNIPYCKHICRRSPQPQHPLHTFNQHQQHHHQHQNFINKNQTTNEVTHVLRRRHATSKNKV